MAQIVFEPKTYLGPHSNITRFSKHSTNMQAPEEEGVPAQEGLDKWMEDNGYHEQSVAVAHRLWAVDTLAEGIAASMGSDDLKNAAVKYCERVAEIDKEYKAASAARAAGIEARPKKAQKLQ